MIPSWSDILLIYTLHFILILQSHSTSAHQNLGLEPVHVTSHYASGALERCLRPLSDVVNYCWMGLRVIVNLKTHFNFTATSGPAENGIFQESAHSTLDLDPLKIFYLRAIQDKFVSYCDPRHGLIQKLDVSFKIWLSPFDSWSWLTLFFSLLFLKVLGLRKWWQKVFSYSKADFYKDLAHTLSLIIVIILATYESYLKTSDVIPAQPYIFANVKELLGSNYQFYHYVAEDDEMGESIMDAYGYDLGKLIRLDDAEHRLEAYFHVEKGKRLGDAWSGFLSLIKTNMKLANINWAMYLSWDVLRMERETGSKCHYLTQPFNNQKSYWVFQGTYRKDFERAFDALVTSGIVGWCDLNGLYWDGLHNHRELVEATEKHQMGRPSQVKPISLQHQLVSIFPILGYVYLCAACVLLAELLIRKSRQNKVDYKKIRNPNKH